MSTGAFVDFNLPYSRGGMPISSEQQAESILIEAQRLTGKGAIGVAITYSANYGQTRAISQTYLAGGWHTHTGGANQAAVIGCMETLLAGRYMALQRKMRIAPITTMNAYVDPVVPWNEEIHLGIAITDLDRIEAYLMCGWVVLGWQNQTTVTNPQHPYAIGGGIAALPAAVSDRIQRTLCGFALNYPEKPL